MVAASLQGDPRKIVSFQRLRNHPVLALHYFHALSQFAGPSEAHFPHARPRSIYLLIAGTHTPFTLVTLRGAWAIFGIIWSLALFGSWCWKPCPDGATALSMVVYVLMGLLVALKPLLAALPTAGFCGLLLGGICYIA